MDDAAELLQLAHLLRSGAEAARDTASLPSQDRLTIERLAAQAVLLAESVEAVARGRTLS